MIFRPEPLIYPPIGPHTASFIFLHGLGDSGNGWRSVFNELRKHEQFDEIKFVLPSAPAIPVTANERMRMPAWYDFPSFNAYDSSTQFLVRTEDEESILCSRTYIHGLIQQEVDGGIPSDRIMIGGFSQGGAITLFSGITHDVKLGGILVMSAGLLLNNRLGALISDPQPNQNTPIFMVHGSEDQIISLYAAELSHKLLAGKDYNVTLKVYPGMGHTTSPEELEDIKAFLHKTLPPLNKSEKEVDAAEGVESSQMGPQKATNAEGSASTETNK